MNSTPRSFPGLVSLYRHDLIIRRTAKVAGFGVLFAVGMLWVSQPVSSLPTPIDNSFDVAMMKVASLGGIVMSGLALLILLWRWMRLRRILTEGLSSRDWWRTLMSRDQMEKQQQPLAQAAVSPFLLCDPSLYSAGRGAEGAS